MHKPAAKSPASKAGKGRGPMGLPALVTWGVLALVAFCSFVALGNWQVQRRAWKHELIERVQTRVHAPASPAPQRAQWPSITSFPNDYEYRHISLNGVLLNDKTSLVQATTVLGQGYWVMTPLRLANDDIVFINRGFVPRAQANSAWRSNQPQPASVVGLLRLSEPEGAFLRDNNLEQDLWYSRNLAQLAQHHGLSEKAAPYFVDAEAHAPLPATLTLEPPPRLPENMLPVGGLTVVHFNDNHLSYLLTWYALALMVAVGAAYFVREELRVRRQSENSPSR